MEQTFFRWNTTTIGVLAVVTLTLVTYAASLRNGFVRWDDGLLIYENPMIREISPSSFKQIFTTYDPELYIPLTFFSYQIDYLLGGSSPSVYHLQNLLWHILNSLLVLWFAFLLSGRKGIAFAVAMLFAIHPLHAEAVAWASARKDVLSTFFFLGSLIAYLSCTARQKKRFTPYLLSLVLFLFGLLSKVTVLTLPAVLLLIDWYEGRDLRSIRLWIEKVPYAVLSLIFATIALFGKTAVLGSSTLLEKILMAPYSALFFLQKIAVPLKLSVLYPFTGTLAFTNLSVLFSFSVILALGMFTGWTILKTAFASGVSDTEPSPTKDAAFGLAFFFITLSPSLLNFAKGGIFYFASDRYAYIPSIGMLFAGILLIERLTGRLTRPMAKPVIAVLVIAVFSVLTYRQSLVWGETETLFAHALASYPQSHIAHNNVGNAQRAKGKTEEAIASYREALRIAQANETKDERDEYPGQSKILSNLASAERELGNTEEAEARYEESLSLNPKNKYAHLGLGILTWKAGDAAEAEAHYLEALKIDPSFTTALINLGTLFEATDRDTEAIEIYERSLQGNPFYPQAWYNLAVTYEKVGRMYEGMESYEKAVSLAPTFTAARINLGIAYAQRKRIREAREQFEAVLRYDPENRTATSALSQLSTSERR